MSIISDQVNIKYYFLGFLFYFSIVRRTTIQTILFTCHSEHLVSLVLGSFRGATEYV